MWTPEPRKANTQRSFGQSQTGLWNNYNKSSTSQISAASDRPSHPVIRDLQSLHIDTAASGSTEAMESAALARHDSARSPCSQKSEVVETKPNNNMMLTPPSTPSKPQRSDSQSSIDSSILESDLLNLDIDVTRGELLGTGLWSKVYKVVPASLPTTVANGLMTPPSTPQKSSMGQLPRAFAVKVASRRDAVPVFEAEARILREIKRHDSSEQHIIPFFGFSPKNSALVFECASHGDLETLMREKFSAPQLLDTFTSISKQLVAGLAFLHDCGVVHADIKPANILLSESETSPHLIARFADFSASTLTFDTSSSNPFAAGGGTWDFMAPEQLSRDKTLSAPSFASDVWSLGITLLSLLIGDSPYEATSSNLFMLREAVKMGTPEAFARREFHFEKRMDSVTVEWQQQGAVGESPMKRLLPGLRKKVSDRTTAREWAV